MSHPSPLTTAPAFTLPTQKGDTRSLGDFLKKGPVLLAFHRGTW
jgi:peroxiredoxin